MESRIVFVEGVTTQRNKEEIALISFEFLSKLSEHQASQGQEDPGSPQTKRNAFLTYSQLPLISLTFYNCTTVEISV